MSASIRAGYCSYSGVQSYSPGSRFTLVSAEMFMWCIAELWIDSTRLTADHCVVGRSYTKHFQISAPAGAYDLADIWKPSPGCGGGSGLESVSASETHPTPTTATTANT